MIVNIEICDGYNNLLYECIIMTSVIRSIQRRDETNVWRCLGKRRHATGLLRPYNKYKQSAE